MQKAVATAPGQPTQYVEMTAAEEELFESERALAPQISLNEKLEEVFSTVLPQHLGQPYLTDEVIRHIMQTKVAVRDANQIDPTGYLGASTIRGLDLPQEMLADKGNILAVFNDIIE